MEVQGPGANQPIQPSNGESSKPLMDNHPENAVIHTLHDPVNTANQLADVMKDEGIAPAEDADLSLDQQIEKSFQEIKDAWGDYRKGVESGEDLDPSDIKDMLSDLDGIIADLQAEVNAHGGGLSDKEIIFNLAGARTLGRLIQKELGKANPNFAEIRIKVSEMNNAIKKGLEAYQAKY